MVLFLSGCSIVTHGGEPVTLKDFLVFISGQEVQANTCDLKLQIPICHPDYVLFKQYMVLSIMGHSGF
jgi:hypothetical protein